MEREFAHAHSLLAAKELGVCLLLLDANGGIPVARVANAVSEEIPTVEIKKPVRQDREILRLREAR
jgi:hypothetical protein